MKAWNYDAVVYDGQVFCVECLPARVDPESDDVTPIFASEEWDHYPICDVCGYEHDYVSLIEGGAIFSCDCKICTQR